MEPDEFQALMKARQSVYDLLRCFFLQEPTEVFLKALKEEEVLKNLTGLHPDLDEGVKLISEVICSSQMALLVPDLIQEFTHLFIGPSPLPLYESVYRSESGLVMQEETLLVRKKYIEAGLLVNPARSFPDDHIGAELEFIFYLCQRGAQAEEGGLRETLMRMQQKFFQEHLVQWVSPLCNRIYEEAKSPYFKGVAKMTQGFISWDFAEIVSHFFD